MCTVLIPPGVNPIAFNKYVSILQEVVHRFLQTIRRVNCTEKVKTPVLKWAAIAPSV